eukprot:4817757-Alexandrium_andersonii.AAC.1
MSASLVGSEMCIRDSIRASSEHHPNRASSGWRARMAHPDGPPGWRARMAVSYTHLTLPTICSV